MTDWADKKAEEMVRVIGVAATRLTIANYIAAELRVVRTEGEQAGMAQGFDAAGKVIDNVFGDTKASERLAQTKPGASTP